MELKFDLWHLAFAYLVTHNAPPNFDVQSEVRLSVEPQRADMILLRRKDVEQLDGQATVLRGLWRQIAKVAVLEYKSPINYAFKPGDLIRLCVYGMLYELSHLDELPRRSDLTLVLVVASVTPTLMKELERLEARLVLHDEGYARIEGLGYTCIVAIIDDVCVAERDEYLRVFSRHRGMTMRAANWARQWMREAKMRTTEIDEKEADEWVQQLMDRMPLERRLAGLNPEQRLAGLDMKQRYDVVPLEVLRALPEEFIESLPEDLQRHIRQRLRNEAH